MKRLIKLLGWTILILIILYMPLMTEYRVQKAKWHIRNNPNISDLIDDYGKPSRVYYPGGCTIALNGEKVDLAEGEELWVYHEEGIPYWVFGVVIEDGITIKRSLVDRFW